MPKDNLSRNRIKDARGRSVSQLDPVSLHVLHRNDTVEADVLHQIVEDIEPGTARQCHVESRGLRSSR